MRMQVRRDMINGHAICHGGIIFTLADTAFAYSCNSYNANTVAQTAQITFIAAVKEGETLIAEAYEQAAAGRTGVRSEEHTSELQSLMRNSYADVCWKTT